MSTDDAAAQLAAWRARHSEVRQVQLLFTDLNGIARGKSVRIEAFDHVFHDGLPLPSSIAALTVDGDDSEGSGLVWEVGDMDGLARLVPGTLLPCPWLATPSAQALLSFDPAQGGPATVADPRHLAARAIAALAELGYTPVLAVEWEFYLFEADHRGGAPRPATPRGAHPHVYGVEEIEAQQAFLDDLHRCCALQGLPLVNSLSEFGPGQFEVTLAHQDDALRALDQAVLFKRAVRGVARRHGLLASFMAKPLAARPGSGMHLHLSLNDADGRNAFASEDPGGNALLRQALAGMAASAPELMALFAPFANSYRRFAPYNCVPLTPSWGVNNRTVALRIPSGAAASRHIEHRICGADANPYLAAAAVLAGARHGLTEALDPGPPVEGDGYAQAGGVPLPRHWPQAIEALAASRFAREALGERFVDVFIAVKRTESERWSAEVPQQDYDWYLHTL